MRRYEDEPKLGEIFHEDFESLQHGGQHAKKAGGKVVPLASVTLARGVGKKSKTSNESKYKRKQTNRAHSSTEDMINAAFDGIWIIGEENAALT